MSTVKILSTGKVRLSISKSLKPFILELLVMFMNRLDITITRSKLTIHNNDDRVYRALVDEVFCKYHTQLSLINSDVKIVLTLAQAHVIWELCQEWDQSAFDNAQMGGLLMELHQKLISL